MEKINFKVKDGIILFLNIILPIISFTVLINHDLNIGQAVMLMVIFTLLISILYLLDTFLDKRVSLPFLFIRYVLHILIFSLTISTMIYQNDLSLKDKEIPSILINMNYLQLVFPFLYLLTYKEKN